MKELLALLFIFYIAFRVTWFFDVESKFKIGVFFGFMFTLVLLIALLIPVLSQLGFDYGF